MALGEVEVALMIDAKNATTLLIRADIYFLKRKYNHSLAGLDNAIRIAPNNSFVLIAQSELFCKLKYYKDALNNEAFVDFNKSLESYPLDMILEHQDGRKEGCKVGGGKNGSEDGQDLLVCRNDAGYDKGFVVTQQIFEEISLEFIIEEECITQHLKIYGYAPIYDK
ncbi:hypothetical protein Glove_365g90 [Diversispora epigaea]|uniref:Uncharacterized protein n=1 Tax=Diversispora epigaea TaxID=1348612 RepID=A0A397HBP3_9GLOM|nr:hypothetical protein Glove_365g90 [Diversispora epigaea]